MRNELADIEACCRRIVEEGRIALAWEWDDYISAMLAAFNVKHADHVHGVLDSNFASQWDHREIVRAPASIQRIAHRLGGLRPTQRLYVTPEQERIVAYGAWWPWGNDQTISIRIGLVLDHMDDMAAAQLHAEFISWFTGEPVST